MSAWPTRLALAAIASIGVGIVVSIGVAIASVQLVDRGWSPMNEVGLHVREGRFWEIATDSAFGLRWVNTERRQQPSSNPSLTIPGIPSWAEPRSAGPIGQWRVGTLAVGWPWPMAARQWSEFEADRLFVPHAELDDDGFTIGKMATHFFGASHGATYLVAWGGAIADVALFSAVALTVFLPRVFSRRASAAAPAE